MILQFYDKYCNIFSVKKIVINMKTWREAASLIIAAKTPSEPGLPYDYNLLFLKRQSTGSYGGAYVFPGGMIEPSDADLKWESLFENHGFNETSFKSLIPASKTRPEIFGSVKNELIREVSLRISAIRETFEECGILFCADTFNTNQTPRIASNFILPKDELEYWQHKVHNDSKEFYNMCEHLKCYPNIWALYEWRNWMSASHFAIAKRVNTAFFLTGLPSIPDTNLEYKEIEDFLWTTPKYMSETHVTSLFPPQRYELSTLGKFKNCDSLLDYAEERSKIGTDRFFSVAVGLNDGMVFLLPGDSMYPKDINIFEKKKIDNLTMSIRDFRKNATKINRIEFFNDSGITDVICKL